MAFTYHPGELALQARVGSEAEAEANAGGITEDIPPAAAAFLAQQPVLVAGHRTTGGAVWASVLHGPRGFARARDARTVTIDAAPHPADALEGSLAAGPVAIGLLAIEPATRRRMRLNGTATAHRGRLTVRVEEVFGNCPKYIHTREPEPGGAAPEAPAAEGARAQRLTPAQQALLAAVDTFFIASAHPDRGADASHRGGRPGFLVASPGGDRLTFPDYRGNGMFMTLGNLEAEPAVGLAIPDWSTGGVLQVRGNARIDHAPQRAARFPRAERVVDVEVEEVVLLPGALGGPWRFGAFSKVAPPAPQPAGA